MSDAPTQVGTGVDGSTVNPCLLAHQANSATESSTSCTSMELMEKVVCRENVLAAWRRVKGNRGAAGIDGLSVDELMPYCREHWSRIRELLLSDRYRPQAVRRVSIPKASGGERALGIPTVMDRLIQQALLQILQPIFDPHFSDNSYGFRPGRSAHGAVKAVRGHVRSGYRWVVDVDLESFFDRVNHDVLMARVARRVKDKRVLRLIRRYLQAGMCDGGVVTTRTEGTPQGGPLSPLLSNILLDEWDKELESRGHRFARYADDCNIYVRSEAAGKRVMASIKVFLETRLRLRINESKSQVARPWNVKFLGYSMTRHRVTMLKPASISVKRFKAKLRDRFRRGRGQSLNRVIAEMAPVLRGWINYFQLSDVKGVFDDLDQWLRRRLRVIIWRQSKSARTRVRMLRRRGIGDERAKLSSSNGRGPWWNAGASHMNQAFPKRYFQSFGLVSLLHEYTKLRVCSA